MRDILFELCAETLPDCLAARDGGAQRIELCSNLDVGGLTPAPSLVREAIAQADLPIHVMVRPRAGDFHYSGTEFSTMRDTILQMKSCGATGVVFGLLHPDGTVDIERTLALVILARPMQVTFHRAFDETPDLSQALEDVLATGCDRILTSGGQPDVLAGAPRLAQLVTQSHNRIAIAAGGGLRHNNAAEVSRLTQAVHFHGSLRRRLSATETIVDAEDIRSIIDALRQA
jgi:copper homeostasis protein